PIQTCPSWRTSSSYLILNPGFAQPPCGADRNGLASRLIILLPPTVNVATALMYCVPGLFVFHLPTVYGVFLPVGLLAGLGGAVVDGFFLLPASRVKD